MSHIANDIWAENRMQFLDEHGKTEADVLMDLKGIEYIEIKSELLTLRVDLPAKLQKNYEPDYKQHD